MNGSFEFCHDKLCFIRFISEGLILWQSNVFWAAGIIHHVLPLLRVHGHDRAAVAKKGLYL